MAGLSVLLETTTATTAKQQHQFAARTPPPPSQIISKATVLNATTTARSNPSSSSASSSSAPPPPMATCSSFLHRCFLCHRELADGVDIYIYRGDRAFCSEECRCRHILVEDDDCARVFTAGRSRRRRPGAAGEFAF
ncbi:hypothetical protein PR202_gb13657 [Eleusine coracana subsp. coracana]|uniref:FLZ-type domain-containing protein n=1 Tax=Eleusine coracana subsp. coracana TaxID=191504 RepID=A0AAV5EQT1_ELECO|nr:hypothetical protein QOZ80_9BG0718010 [Eleusine coracana subsp. coracana]GJN25784.1 hypothetical protein PR202_gb13657 [Eleusine coracana subsp. coracana]